MFICSLDWSEVFIHLFIYQFIYRPILFWYNQIAYYLVYLLNGRDGHNLHVHTTASCTDLSRSRIEMDKMDIL